MKIHHTVVRSKDYQTTIMQMNAHVTLEVNSDAEMVPVSLYTSAATATTIAPTPPMKTTPTAVKRLPSIPITII